MKMSKTLSQKGMDIGLEKGDSMLSKIRANTMAKKSTIFAAVFATTCIIMGNHLVSLSDEQDLIKAMTIAVRDGQAFVQAQLESIMPQAVYTVRSGVENIPFSGDYTQTLEGTPGSPPIIVPNIPTPDGFVYTDQIPLSKELQKYTYHRCVETGLEYELVLALMWRESRFQIDAVNLNTNGTRDSGIMQINDVNRGWLREKHNIVDLMDPVQNIDAGTIMLSDLVEKYGVHNALMAYEFGEQGMQRQFSRGVTTSDNIQILMSKRGDFQTMLQEA